MIVFVKCRRSESKCFCWSYVFADCNGCVLLRTQEKIEKQYCMSLRTAMIVFRRDCTLQLVSRIATQYNLQRGRNILEELKMIINCFIQRSNFTSSEYVRSLNSTVEALWEFLQAEIKARDSLLCESRPIWPISDDDMIVDDPPVLTPDQHLHTLEALQGTRQRALSTRNR